MYGLDETERYAADDVESPRYSLDVQCGTLITVVPFVTADDPLVFEYLVKVIVSPLCETLPKTELSVSDALQYSLSAVASRVAALRGIDVPKSCRYRVFASFAARFAYSSAVRYLMLFMSPESALLFMARK